MAVTSRILAALCLSLALQGIALASSEPSLSKIDTPPTGSKKPSTKDLKAMHARWLRFIAAGPSEPGDLRVDSYLWEVENAYGLDANQAAPVRREIESMAADRRRAMGKDADTYTELEYDAAAIWSSYRQRAVEDEDAAG